MHTQNKSTAAGHTKGPWAVTYGHCRLVITDAAERDLALCNLQCENGDEDEANARLIAAAPELLEALDWALGVITSPNRVMDSRALRQARAAIARAKGVKS